VTGDLRNTAREFIGSTWKEQRMSKEIDPAAIVERFRQEILVSSRGERRIRAHRFKELFGYQVLTASRRESIEELLNKAGIVVQPPLADVGRDDWLKMSLPEPPVIRDTHPDPRPTPDQVDYLMSVQPHSEREVEIHFVSPLFINAFHYTPEQEAAGFPVPAGHGSRPRHIEADLIYFADEVHDLEKGQPLVLVECKRPGGPLDSAVTQVRDYAMWVRPAYYIITDSQSVAVWDYQGAIGPDRKLWEVKQAELADRLDDLYKYLNRDAALETRQRKIAAMARASADVTGHTA
jgi:hypothetical protein